MEEKLPKMLIFLLEDYTETSNLIKDFLEHDLYRAGVIAEVSHSVSYTEATYQLQKRDRWDLILLDYTLEGDIVAYPNNGAAVAQFIKINGIKYGKVIVHSNNPYGATFITQELPDAEKSPIIETRDWRRLIMDFVEEWKEGLIPKITKIGD